MTSLAAAHALIESMTCLPPSEVSADELIELIEGAEEEGNVAAIVAALLCVSQTDPALEDGEVAAEGACDALMRLVPATVSSADAGEAGACAALVAALARFGEEASVVEVALGCVRDLASAPAKGPCPANQAALGAAGIAELLVTVMGEHTEGEPTLQEMGCLAVEALAAGCPANVVLIDAAGIRATLGAARECITNDRNKTYVVGRRVIMERAERG
jgi:hypothetical protein